MAKNKFLFLFIINLIKSNLYGFQFNVNITKDVL